VPAGTAARWLDDAQVPPGLCRQRAEQQAVLGVGADFCSRGYLPLSSIVKGIGQAEDVEP
jgi:hypothetical protein